MTGRSMARKIRSGTFGAGNLKKMVAAVFFNSCFWQGLQVSDYLGDPPPPSCLHPEITVAPWLRPDRKSLTKNIQKEGAAPANEQQPA